ncbi:helix-turn-helix domain-containing protein [Candidatus Vondammii sp. HM_W22]|uniref:helix-turn-helix domain-containing protein n=1 Tax=Candidatus Vondammii sp. HM_W22 TaxID=2687299 RepID=UPI00403E0B19
MIVKQRLKPQNKTVRYQPMSGRSFTDYAEGFSLVRQRNEIKHQFIQCHSAQLPVNRLCQMVGLSRSSYYAWVKRYSHFWCMRN